MTADLEERPMTENAPYGAEVQTTIDECSDGSWEGVLYLGSNFETRFHRATFHEVAAALALRIDELRPAASGSDRGRVIQAQPPMISGDSHD